MCRYRLGRRTRFALRPDRPVGPDVDLADVAQLAVADLVRGFPHAVQRRELIAHLRGDAFFPSQLAQQAGLVNRVGQRFLAKDVFSRADCHGGGQGVNVIRRTDGDGIHAIAQLVQHLAKVGERLCLKPFTSPFQLLPVDIADRHDLAVPCGIA